MKDSAYLLPFERERNQTQRSIFLMFGLALTLMVCFFTAAAHMLSHYLAIGGLAVIFALLLFLIDRALVTKVRCDENGVHLIKNSGAEKFIPWSAIDEIKVTEWDNEGSKSYSLDIVNLNGQTIRLDSDFVRDEAFVKKIQALPIRRLALQNQIDK